MGTVPIGNGLAVSALQMLQVYVTLANGGMYRPPRLVEATIDADGVRHPVPVAEPRRVVSADTAGKLSTMLTKVVQEGTGTNAAVPGYLAAGKTGTARKPLEGARGYSGNYVASFVGFVPSQDPRLAAVVVLDEPTPIYGGQVSAPVFARIMQYALRLERIPPPPGSPPPVARRRWGSGPRPRRGRRPTTTRTSPRRRRRRPSREVVRPRPPTTPRARPPSRRRPTTTTTKPKSTTQSTRNHRTPSFDHDDDVQGLDSQVVDHDDDPRVGRRPRRPRRPKSAAASSTTTHDPAEVDDVDDLVGWRVGEQTERYPRAG